ncbi:MAG TPA: hypothetical protein VKT80_09565 [Chloroflexota bacterium]|nr:hypothetical protein [Chloroflexota bacterium]
MKAEGVSGAQTVFDESECKALFRLIRRLVPYDYPIEPFTRSDAEKAALAKLRESAQKESRESGGK